MTPAPRTNPRDTAPLAPRRGPLAGRDLWEAPIGKGWGLKRPDRARMISVYRYHRNAGVGIALGPSAGVIDVEVDDEKEAGPILARLSLPQTLAWTSPRGAHRLYRWDARLPGLGLPAVMHLGGLEIRMGGASKQLVSVCPPSSGREWSGDWNILPFPDPLLAVLGGTRRQPVRRTVVPERVTSRYAAAALRGESANVRAAVDGTRNNTLFRAAFNLGQLVGAGLIGRGGVESELIDAALSVGLGEREVLRTLKSGMDAGIEKPRR